MSGEEEFGAGSVEQKIIVPERQGEQPLPARETITFEGEAVDITPGVGEAGGVEEAIMPTNSAPEVVPLANDAVLVGNSDVKGHESTGSPEVDSKKGFEVRVNASSVLREARHAGRRLKPSDAPVLVPLSVNDDMPGAFESQKTVGTVVRYTGDEVRVSMSSEVALASTKNDSAKSRNDAANRVSLGFGDARRVLTDAGADVITTRSEGKPTLAVDVNGQQIVVQYDKRERRMIVKGPIVVTGIKEDDPEFTGALESYANVYSTVLNRVGTRLGGRSISSQVIEIGVPEQTVGDVDAEVSSGQKKEDEPDIEYVTGRNRQERRREKKLARREEKTKDDKQPNRSQVSRATVTRSETGDVQVTQADTETHTASQELRELVAADVAWVNDLEIDELPNELSTNANIPLEGGAIISLGEIKDDNSHLYRLDLLPETDEGNGRRLRVTSLGALIHGGLTVPNQIESRVIDLDGDSMPLNDAEDNNTFFEIVDSQLHLLTGESNENRPAVWRGRTDLDEASDEAAVVSEAKPAQQEPQPEGSEEPQRTQEEIDRLSQRLQTSQDLLTKALAAERDKVDEIVITDADLVEDPRARQWLLADVVQELKDRGETTRYMTLREIKGMLASGLGKVVESQGAKLDNTTVQGNRNDLGIRINASKGPGKVEIYVGFKDGGNRSGKIWLDQFNVEPGNTAARIGGRSQLKEISTQGQQSLQDPNAFIAKLLQDQLGHDVNLSGLGLRIDDQVLTLRMMGSQERPEGPVHVLPTPTKAQLDRKWDDIQAARSKEIPTGQEVELLDKETFEAFYNYFLDYADLRDADPGRLTDEDEQIYQSMKDELYARMGLNDPADELIRLEDDVEMRSHVTDRARSNSLRFIEGKGGAQQFLTDQARHLGLPNAETITRFSYRQLVDTLQSRPDAARTSPETHKRLAVAILVASEKFLQGTASPQNYLVVARRLEDLRQSDISDPDFLLEFRELFDKFRRLSPDIANDATDFNNQYVDKFLDALGIKE